MVQTSSPQQPRRLRKGLVDWSLDWRMNLADTKELLGENPGAEVVGVLSRNESSPSR